MTKLKNSGNNQQFSTGAIRDTVEEKPRPGLISPYATMREGHILAKGAKIYAERNWEAGIPISRCIESLERHIMQYKMGMNDEDHMAHARCNTGFILHFEEMIKKGIIPVEIDDMPKYET